METFFFRELLHFRPRSPPKKFGDEVWSNRDPFWSVGLYIQCVDLCTDAWLHCSSASITRFNDFSLECVNAKLPNDLFCLTKIDPIQLYHHTQYYILELLSSFEASFVLVIDRTVNYDYSKNNGFTPNLLKLSACNLLMPQSGSHKSRIVKINDVSIKSIIVIRIHCVLNDFFS